MKTKLILLLTSGILTVSSLPCISQVKYLALNAAEKPEIDGDPGDECWEKAAWYDVSYLWLYEQPSSSDFSARFKVCWNEDKLYVLAEITDDVLNDHYSDPLSNYWEDDTWEIFLDEDASGGDHMYNYNAFAYHISSLFDVADIGVEASPRLFNDHVQVARTVNGTTYTWEAAVEMYTDDFVYGASDNPKADMYPGKIFGFAMAYCDNDGGDKRQSFIGSEDIPGQDKNLAWHNADVFGKMELADIPTAMNSVEKPGFSFSPNPASGSLKLRTDVSGNITLVDIYSKILVEKKISSPGSQTVDISHLLPGTYLLLFNSEEGDFLIDKVIVRP